MPFAIITTDKPGHEQVRAEHQAGDHAGVERLITQLEQSLAAVDEDYEPEPETQKLITQLRQRHAMAS